MLEARTCTAHQNFYRWHDFIVARFYAGNNLPDMGVHCSGLNVWHMLSHLLEFRLLESRVPVKMFLEVKENIFMQITTSDVYWIHVEGCGNFIGFLTGVGNANEQIATYEFHRIK